MWRTTGSESSIASYRASGPSTLANGVRTPAASQMTGREGEFMIARPLLVIAFYAWITVVGRSATRASRLSRFARPPRSLIYDSGT